MEIERLHKMLMDAGIEHEWNDRSQWYGRKRGRFELDINWGWQVLILRPDGERLVSAVEGYGTHGFGLRGEQGDSIEIMGLLTPEEEEYDSVVGWLTAEEVFGRIKEALCGSK